MISAHHLVYQHKDFKILDEISLHVKYGEFIAIVGANGAGKSSLLSILANEIKSKNVIFKGQFLQNWSFREIAFHKAKFSQHNSQDIPLEVKDVVMMGRYPYFEGKPTAVDEKIVNEMMLDTDIFHLKNRDYNTLSGGEKQRTHLARVLAQLENKVLQKLMFLDEPLNNLDIKYQYKTLELIKKFTQNTNAAIVVLHDLNLAAQFADKILLMKSGKVLSFGLPHEVLTEKNITEAYNFPCTICKHPVNTKPMIIFG